MGQNNPAKAGSRRNASRGLRRGIYKKVLREVSRHHGPADVSMRDFVSMTN
jgi:hypothetical protein